MTGLPKPHQVLSLNWRRPLLITRTWLKLVPPYAKPKPIGTLSVMASSINGRSVPQVPGLPN